MNNRFYELLFDDINWNYVLVKIYENIVVSSGNTQLYTIFKILAHQGHTISKTLTHQEMSEKWIRIFHLYTHKPS